MRSGLGWRQRTQIRLSDCGTMEDATSRLHWKSLFIVTVQSRRSVVLTARKCGDRTAVVD